MHKISLKGYTYTQKRVMKLAPRGQIWVASAQGATDSCFTALSFYTSGVLHHVCSENCSKNCSKLFLNILKGDEE